MHPLAVIPIFVNAGVAVLPVILGAAGGMLALFLRPRQLASACRRHPFAALSVAAAAAGAYLLVGLLLGGRSAAGAPRGGEGVDWAGEALASCQRQRAGVDLAALSAGRDPDSAMGLGRDFTRNSYDRAGAPVRLAGLWAHRQEDALFLSSPLVRAGRVYGASCQLDVTGKYGSVLCLDALTGAVKWETTALEDKPLKPFFSSPAITRDGKSLVIGQGLHDDADCALLCLEADTGKVRWQVKTPLHVEGSPAIWGDVVVAGAGAIEGPDRKPAGHIGMVLAVRISDGTKLWQYDLNDPESSPAIGEDGTVYIGSGFNGQAVVALRIDSDEQLREKGQDRLLWRTPSPYPVTGAVTLAGDLAVVGGGNGDYVVTDPNPAGVVLALERKTGQVRWQRPMPDAVLGAIAFADGRLYCPVRNGDVVALSASTGQPLWRQRVSGQAPVLAAPAVADGHVYAVSRDGFLAVLDARDGALLEKHDLNDPAKPGALGLSLSSPSVVGCRVYVGSETGGLRCFAGTKAP